MAKIDRKTYYTEKYGENYFKLIGSKGGKNGIGTWGRKRAQLKGGLSAAREYQRDPESYLARFKNKRRKKTTPYRTCPCGLRHEFTDRVPSVISCPCGRKVWYIPND